MTAVNHSSKIWNKLHLHKNVDAAFSSCVPLQEVDFCKRQKLIMPMQTHTSNVVWITDKIALESPDSKPSPILPDTDALITDTPNIAIGVRTADCVPILLYADDIKAVAAIHAGWKGTINGIVDNAIDMLIDKGSVPTHIFACFGPSICRQCYEIDFALAQQFIDAGFADCITYDDFIDPLTENKFTEAKPHLDLVKVNFKRMINKGLTSLNINTSSPCTRHTFSSISEDNDLLRNTIDQCTIETANSRGNSNPNRPSTSGNKIPVFHSWRREPGTPDRLITAISLHP